MHDVPHWNFPDAHTSPTPLQAGEQAARTVPQKTEQDTGLRWPTLTGSRLFWSNRCKREADFASITSPNRQRSDYDKIRHSRMFLHH